MNYINQNKKRLVGRNNQSLNSFLALDYHISDVIDFQFINDKNQIQNISTGQFYFAGSIILPNNEQKLLFLSNNYEVIDNNILRFRYNTYTQSFLDYIKKKNTQINIEIGFKNNSSGSLQYLILRDYALVNPRCYVDGVPPTNLPEYYTKDEADSRFALLSGLNQLSGNLDNNYWTKQETAEAIANIQTMKLVVVDELPPLSSAEEYTIYLTPSNDATSGNYYNEYLLINQQFELIGSTAIDMTQYVQKSLSGIGSNYINWRTSDGNHNRLRIGDGGFQWGDGRAAAADSNFAAYGAETNIRGIGVRLGFNEISHIYHGNTIENTPGGFVIQNASGGIDANYVSVTGLVQNGVDYQLSSMMPLSGYKFADTNESFTLTSPNDKPLFGVYGSRSIIIGNPNSIYDMPNLYTFTGNYKLYTDSVTLNNHAQNTPGGFVIQDLSGKISAPYFEATSGTTAPSALFTGEVIINTPYQHVKDSVLSLKYNGGTGAYIKFNGIGIGYNADTGSGYGSCSVGYNASAQGEKACVAIGENVRNSYSCSLVIGKYNDNLSGCAITVGNGTSNNDRNNCFIVYNNGDVKLDGNLSLDGNIIQNSVSYDLSSFMPVSGGTFTGEVVASNFISNGDKIITPSSTVITPLQGQVYKHTLEEGDSFTFDLTALSSNIQVDFELHITQPSTAVSNPTWPSSIIWGFGNKFSSLYTAPIMDEASTEYCTIFRWDGSNLLANLAYSKEVIE